MVVLVEPKRPKARPSPALTLRTVCVLLRGYALTLSGEMCIRGRDYIIVGY